MTEFYEGGEQPSQIESNPRRDLNAVKLDRHFRGADNVTSETNEEFFQEELKQIVFAESRAFMAKEEELVSLEIKGLRQIEITREDAKAVKEKVIDLIKSLGGETINREEAIATIAEKVMLGENQEESKRIVEAIYHKVEDNVDRAVEKLIQEDIQQSALRKWAPSVARWVGYTAGGVLGTATGGLGFALGLGAVRVGDEIVKRLWQRHRKNKKHQEILNTLKNTSSDDLEKSSEELRTMDKKEARKILLRRAMMEDFAAAIAVEKQKQIDRLTGTREEEEHEYDYEGELREALEDQDIKQGAELFLNERYGDELNDEQKEFLAKAIAELAELDRKNQELEDKLTEEFSPGTLQRFLGPIIKGLDKVSGFLTGKTTKGKAGSAAIYILGGLIMRSQSVLRRLQKVSGKMSGGLTAKFAQTELGRKIAEDQTLTPILSTAFMALGGMAGGEAIGRFGFEFTRFGKALVRLRNIRARLDKALEQAQRQGITRVSQEAIVQAMADASEQLMTKREWSGVRQRETIDTEYAYIKQTLDVLQQMFIQKTEVDAIDDPQRMEQIENAMQDLETGWDYLEETLTAPPHAPQFNFLADFMNRTEAVAKEERKAKQVQEGVKWASRLIGAGVALTGFPILREKLNAAFTEDKKEPIAPVTKSNDQSMPQIPKEAPSAEIFEERKSEFISSYVYNRYGESPHGAISEIGQKLGEREVAEVIDKITRQAIDPNSKAHYIIEVNKEKIDVEFIPNQLTDYHGYLEKTPWGMTKNAIIEALLKKAQKDGIDIKNNQSWLDFLQKAEVDVKEFNGIPVDIGIGGARTAPRELPKTETESDGLGLTDEMTETTAPETKTSEAATQTVKPLEKIPEKFESIPESEMPKDIYTIESADVLPQTKIEETIINEHIHRLITEGYGKQIADSYIAESLEGIEDAQGNPITCGYQFLDEHHQPTQNKTDLIGWDLNNDKEIDAVARVVQDKGGANVAKVETLLLKNNDGVTEQFSVESQPHLQILAEKIGAQFLKAGDYIRFFGSAGGLKRLEIGGEHLAINPQAEAIAVSIPGIDNQATEGILFFNKEKQAAVFVFDQDNDNIPESFIIKEVDTSNRAIEQLIQIVPKNQFNPLIGFQGNAEGMDLFKINIGDAGLIEIVPEESLGFDAAKERSPSEAEDKESALESKKSKEGIEASIFAKREQARQEFLGFDSIASHNWDKEMNKLVFNLFAFANDNKSDDFMRQLVETVRQDFPEFLEKGGQRLPEQSHLDYLKDLINAHVEGAHSGGHFNPEFSYTNAGDEQEMRKLLQAAQKVLSQSSFIGRIHPPIPDI